MQQGYRDASATAIRDRRGLFAWVGKTAPNNGTGVSRVQRCAVIVQPEPMNLISKNNKMNEIPNHVYTHPDLCMAQVVGTSGVLPQALAGAVAPPAAAAILPSGG
jgi:hypothetical protein